MDQEPKKANENGNSMIWFLLIIVVVLAISAFVVLNQNQKSLDYSHFLDLLQITEYQSKNSNELVDETALLTIQEPGENGRTLKYSHPNDILVGKNRIEGMVNFEVTAPAAAAKKKDRIRFVVNKNDSDVINESLTEALNAAKLRWNFKAGPTFFDKYGFLLITMFLIIALFLMMMRRLGGAGGPMQFGRSRGKLYAEEELGISFDDVAGIDEAVEEVKEVVDFLQNPEKYQKLGGRIPRGVLLVGPPGTGKNPVGQSDRR